MQKYIHITLIIVVIDNNNNEIEDLPPNADETNMNIESNDTNYDTNSNTNTLHSNHPSPYVVSFCAQQFRSVPLV